MNAGPWAALPPPGYGGIEAVVSSIVTELRRVGIRVVLATVGESTLAADRSISVFERGQFAHIADPYNLGMGIAHAHMQAVVAELERNEEIDLVHDHLEVVGPSVLRAMPADAPPVLQTLHWNLRKHPDFYGRFDGGNRVFFAGVSQRQVDLAPERLRRHVVGVVPLGVATDRYRPSPRKADHLLVLARVTEDKGQDVAVRLCRELGLELIMAGPVGGLRSPEELAGSIASNHRDVAFYRERVQPLEDEDRRWIGSVGGAEKDELLASARALLCPIRWEEPGGTAVVEALASGTPVVGYRRGCLPSLVEHGVTGFLADDERELAGYLERLDELDPVACRAAALTSGSAELMAQRYLGLYADVLRRAAGPPVLDEATSKTA
jgi:glycosyltransferase involved in cell wall biosynthesis